MVAESSDSKPKRIRVCKCSHCKNVTEKQRDRYVFGNEVRCVSYTMCGWCYAPFVTSPETKSWLIEPGSIPIAE